MHNKPTREICEQENIPVSETHFKIDDLKQADSAFFTGTAAEVAGLGSIDDYEFPLEWEQSLGYKLSKLYSLEVLGERKNEISRAV